MNPKLRLFCGLFILINVAIAGVVPVTALAQDRSLAEAYRIIASKQFVDLTHLQPADAGVAGLWPGDFLARRRS